jgi:hypothetical protein
MTNNKKQTAVEQLFAEMLEIQQSGKTLTFDENLLLLEKYKEMEKEQKRIQLPSDEEIREVINPFQNEMDDFDLGFRNGVQWLRDKIQGGEQ